MRIAFVIGTVTLSKPHPALVGGRLVIAVPYSLDGLGKEKPDGEDVVVYDQLGAGPDMRIGISEGVEASMPFHPEKRPLDAYCACILDKVEVK
jgi:ethanolamine utilization protein EutN